MPKKYLLYIHNDDQFEQEERKSALVNELLDSHYGNFIANKHNRHNKHVSIKKLTKTADNYSSEETCTGHDTLRWNCGRKGCAYS